MLYHEKDGNERIISYARRGLRQKEYKSPALKLEFLALKWAVVDKFSDLLYGIFFKFRTDNNHFTYVLTSAKLDAVFHRRHFTLATIFTISVSSINLDVQM